MVISYMYTVHCTLYTVQYTATLYSYILYSTLSKYGKWLFHIQYTVTLLYIIKKLNTAYSDPSYLSRILINQPDPNYSFRTLKISD